MTALSVIVSIYVKEKRCITISQMDIWKLLVVRNHDCKISVAMNYTQEQPTWNLHIIKTLSWWRKLSLSFLLNNIVLTKSAISDLKLLSLIKTTIGLSLFYHDAVYWQFMFLCCSVYITSKRISIERSNNWTWLFDITESGTILVVCWS